ncbi:CPBP family intramembrane glutamic endopeptidase [Natrarchaeobius chitinivorans]|uniref:CPBP family intramembrane metalloprotease n=1 Tax=Natrarchaeobius chitinivorans TaxID=1679083 RepID=A0A3N6PDZ9_NATCH|nr:type II CAAX endopeptidase family protein [Natrarchaeobius chitinivorans]RQG97969.1 CPBP family intramembrane metalloprotease [Natrarchaeobius chitinivorans]
MPQPTAFVAIAGVVLALLLVLSHLTQSAFTDGDGSLENSTGPADTADSQRQPNSFFADEPSSESLEERDDRRESNAVTEEYEPNEVSKGREPNDGFDESEQRGGEADAVDRTRKTRGRSGTQQKGVDPSAMSTGMVLANVAVSQGLFALVLLGAVLYTGIPADWLGIEFSRSYLETGLVLGTVAGVVLYVGNELGAAFATRFGFDHDEGLRELLAPDSVRGWLVLLLVVLPIIAVFEELLFRAALIGVVSAGFGVSPWALAVLSSIAFAVGHGVQGTVGIIVTGVLGFVLAAVFILTGSFLVVVVAHYLINALEFVVHEAFGLEWAEPLER